MTDYRSALAAYLDRSGETQAQLAAKVGCAQAAINRYVNGARFPLGPVARRIDEATAGEVPFTLWQSEAAQRAGFAPDKAA